MKAIGVALLVICAGNVRAQKTTAEISYFRDIVPVIQRSCQGFHQPAMKSGGLDLTRYESFAAGGNKGPAFKAGVSQESVILGFLKGERQPRMPFGAPALPADQIELFAGWIAAGAKDDTPPEARDISVPRTPP